MGVSRDTLPPETQGLVPVVITSGEPLVSRIRLITLPPALNPFPPLWNEGTSAGQCGGLQGGAYPNAAIRCHVAPIAPLPAPDFRILTCPCVWPFSPLLTSTRGGKEGKGRASRQRDCPELVSKLGRKLRTDYGCIPNPSNARF
jgi:hypothetical protein